MKNSPQLISFNDKNYEVDDNDYLINPQDWDENFAKGMAKKLDISEELCELHWQIIRYIRDKYTETKSCPNIFTTCRNNNLKLKDLRNLFPSGYHRGACKIAGISYKEGYIKHYYWDNLEKPQKPKVDEIKLYTVDANGFLVYPEDWDEDFALKKAQELKMSSLLTEKQWDIIKFIRMYFEENGEIPNIYTTCDEFYIDLTDMEELFPDGYHRGAVKLAGLRLP